MRNGKYILLVAPVDYPGKKYRGRYAYAHIIEFWRKTGRMPLDNHIVHHRNDDKHDNSWDNLEEKDVITHGKHHAIYACMAIDNCAFCGQLVYIKKQDYLTRLRRGQKRFYCCRSHSVRQQWRDKSGQVVERQTQRV